ncbi:MAG: hypothetical protein ACE5F6_20345, partial [Anaerolineae bacterium]
VLAVELARRWVLGIGYWILDIGHQGRNTQYPIPNIQSPILWTAYILVSALVLYTHYFGFTVLLAGTGGGGVGGRAAPPPPQSGGVVRAPPGWGGQGGWRRLGFAIRWAAAQIAVALLYLPWLALTWRQVQAWPAVSRPFSLAFLLRDTLRIFSLGLSVEPRTTPAIWAFALLFLVGLIGVAIRNSQLTIHNSQGLPCLTTTLYLLTPIAAMYLLSLRRPLYNPKFLLLATPPFHLLLALGIHHVSRAVLIPVESLTKSLSKKFTLHVSRNTQYAIRSMPYAILPTIALLTLLLVPTVRSLENYYFNPDYARDDYRGIARVIEATGRPSDAVLLNAPSQIEIFDYYYNGSLSQYPLPRERPPDAGGVRAELQQIVSQHGRIYGIFWATDESDPEGIVESWLDEHTYKAMDAWYGNVRLVLYAVPPAAEQGTAYDIGAQLGDKITLRDAKLVTRSVESGDVLPLTLRWQASAPLEARYKVFVQLLSPTNQLIAQRDAEPGGGARLTTTWEPGDTIVDRYGLWVRPGTPPADYRLITGMYHLKTGQRLPVTRDGQPAGDFIDLGTIRVVAPQVPPPIEALNLSQRVGQDYGAVRLLGYTLDKRGAENQPGVPIHPGDTLRVVMFWQARTSPGFDLELNLTLLKDKQAQSRIKVTPTDGIYPASSWSAGEVVRDAHDFPLPANLAPGRYQLRLVVSRAGGPSLGEPLLIPVAVEAR